MFYSTSSSDSGVFAEQQEQKEVYRFVFSGNCLFPNGIILDLKNA